jgi:cation diffusion facilitator CzcD-associated flavoprotein CzcO
MPGHERLTEYDVVIIGTGFAGMYMLHRVREMGLSVRAYEAGDGVGGTWYWNRYPGARCDVESMEYSYGFADELQQEWEWTERYATQPEILAYANHVADRFDLRRDIQFSTRVTSAHYDEAANRWRVRTDAGDAVSARFVIAAVGLLSSLNVPHLPGLDTFAGSTYHTGNWPHDGVDFSGKRVAVIGTGSSGIQSIPMIARQARELFVFQRTANYSIPAHNQTLAPELIAEIKATYPEFRAANRLMPVGFGSRFPINDGSALEIDDEERELVFEARWAFGGLGFLGAFNDLIFDDNANEYAAEFVRRKIRATVKDPEVAELLIPKTRIGCKRLCVDTGYYETFNEDHVTLVDISTTPIERATPRGLVVDGNEYQLDCIVFATGFDAITGSMLRIDFRGRGGVALTEAWEGGPRSYLGLGVAGFPNVFMISGPLSPAALTNVIVSIEHNVDFIADCITYLDEQGYSTIEATEPAQDAWAEHVNAIAQFTIYPSCNSWYLGSNVPGKPRVFMTLLGFPPYVERCDDVAAKGYEGFTLSR